jgi:tripartite-type tricarboxylate transporter receptor subunit TctC
MSNSERRLPLPRRRRLVANASGLLVAATLPVGSALAQPVIPLTVTYPTRPIRLVVPGPRGSAADTIARAIAQPLSAELGFEVQVENRPGAGGNDGAGLVANGAADGHTLLLGALTAHAIRGALFVKTVPFDLEQSFAPVSILGTVPRVVLVHRDIATSLAELIAQARTRPGAFIFASGGEGSLAHLAGVLMQNLAGVVMRHAAHGGSEAALRSVAQGDAHLMVAAVPDALPHLGTGAVRALAIAGKDPVAQLPDVPVAGQAGLEAFEADALYGLLAPAGTPDTVLAKLNAVARTAMDKPDVRQALAAAGVIALSTPLPEAQAAVRAESAKWKKLVREARLQGR